MAFPPNCRCVEQLADEKGMVACGYYFLLSGKRVFNKSSIFQNIMCVFAKDVLSESHIMVTKVFRSFAQTHPIVIFFEIVIFIFVKAASVLQDFHGRQLGGSLVGPL